MDRFIVAERIMRSAVSSFQQQIKVHLDRSVDTLFSSFDFHVRNVSVPKPRCFPVARSTSNAAAQAGSGLDMDFLSSRVYMYVYVCRIHCCRTGRHNTRSTPKHKVTSVFINSSITRYDAHPSPLINYKACFAAAAAGLATTGPGPFIPAPTVIVVAAATRFVMLTLAPRGLRCCCSCWGARKGLGEKNGRSLPVCGR